MRYSRLHNVREAYGSRSLAFYVGDAPTRTVIRCWRTLDPILTITYHESRS